MHRLGPVLRLSLASAALVAGCARSAPVDVAMISAHEEPTRFAFVPQYVDVRHASKGWQRVPLATSATKMELLEYGHRVRLATTNLPNGTYTAVRVGFLVPESETPRVRRTSRAEPPPDDDARRNLGTVGELPIQQQEFTIVRTFCVDRAGDDNQLVLRVFGAHPAHPEEGPTLTIEQAPRC